MTKSIYIKMKKLIFIFLTLVLTNSFYIKIAECRTLTTAIQQYGPKAEVRLKKSFLESKTTYPPQQIALIAFKKTNSLGLWAKNKNANWELIKNYEIKAASGQLGPKLKEGDLQVPEGIYKITALNPNSSYHLSMKINYPNSFDWKWANHEGRKTPGTNIFIHGKAVSIGCLAMGDTAIEELFSLVHKIGKANAKVIISPTNPTLGKLKPPQGSQSWVTELYKNIEQEFYKIKGSNSF